MSRKITLALAGVCLFALPLVVGCSGQPKDGIHSFSVGPGFQQTFLLEFPAGKRVNLAVHSNGSSDVDLFVHDERGNLVTADESPSQHCQVQFVPARTQVYRVVVMNRILVDAPQRNGHNAGTLRWYVN